MMFEIELKNLDEISIKCKDRAVNINVAQYQVSANGLAIKSIVGPGEFEIGELSISAIAVGEGVMYRVVIGRVRIGLVGAIDKMDRLDDLGPVDILGATDAKVVGLTEPKIVIPMGNMDYSELKAEVKVEKKLKIKSEATLPVTMEVWKLD